MFVPGRLSRLKKPGSPDNLTRSTRTIALWQPKQPSATYPTVVPAKAGIQEIPRKRASRLAEGSGFRLSPERRFYGAVALAGWFDKLTMSGLWTWRRLCPYPVTPSGYAQHLLVSPPGRGGFVTRPAFNGKDLPVNRWAIAGLSLSLPAPEQGRVRNPPLPSNHPYQPGPGRVRNTNPRQPPFRPAESVDSPATGCYS